MNEHNECLSIQPLLILNIVPKEQRVLVADGQYPFDAGTFLPVPRNLFLSVTGHLPQVVLLYHLMELPVLNLLELAETPPKDGHRQLYNHIPEESYVARYTVGLLQIRSLLRSALTGAFQRHPQFHIAS